VTSLSNGAIYMISAKAQPPTPQPGIQDLASTSIVVSPGRLFRGPVAMFSDIDAGITSQSFTAVILWGDRSSPTVGKVEETSPDSFSIVSRHRYFRRGTYHFTVLLTDGAGNTSSVTGTALVTRVRRTGHRSEVLPGGTMSLHIGRIIHSPSKAMLALGERLLRRAGRH
jgi:hypothetical protein